jgi:hypothetical protein
MCLSSLYTVQYFALETMTIKNNMIINPSLTSSQNDFDFVLSKWNIQKISVLEIRNYLIKPQKRDAFIEYFEDNLIEPQNILGGYPLGQNLVKGEEDRFVWFRGFVSMTSRYKFLNDFYFGPAWKTHKTLPNSLLLNNDFVYLLKPLFLDRSVADLSFNPIWFGQQKGIVVVDCYIANHKLSQLIHYFRTGYAAKMAAAGILNISFWVSEEKENDFTTLPVFQDPNLLLTIGIYENELEYEEKTKTLRTSMDDICQTAYEDLVTIKNTMILYPTEKSFAIKTDRPLQ